MLESGNKDIIVVSPYISEWMICCFETRRAHEFLESRLMPESLPPLIWDYDSALLSCTSIFPSFIEVRFEGYSAPFSFQRLLSNRHSRILHVIDNSSFTLHQYPRLYRVGSRSWHSVTSKFAVCIVYFEPNVLQLSTTQQYGWRETARVEQKWHGKKCATALQRLRVQILSRAQTLALCLRRREHRCW